MNVMEIMRRGRMKRRYESGIWEPGPNAMWQLKSPGDLAKKLSESKRRPSESAPAPKHADKPASSPKQDQESIDPKTVAKMDNVQLAKMIDDHGKGNPAKKKRVRDRANEPHFSLREIVKDRGGISLSSLEATGFDVKALMESGLQYRGLFRREGGQDISEMAEELHSNGDIAIPGYAISGAGRKGEETTAEMKRHASNAPQYLLDQLLIKAKTLHKNKDQEFEKSYKRYLKEERDAKRNPEAGFDPSTSEAIIRSGQAAGEAEAGEGDSLTDDSELAEEGGSQADESGATDIGDFDPTKFQHGTRGKNRYEEDAQGHQHKGKGPGGGQFTGKAEHGQSSDEMAKKLKQGNLFDAPQNKAPDNKAPDELVGNRKPEKLPSPDELARSLGGKPGEKVSASEAEGLYYNKLPIDSNANSPFYGYPKLIAAKVAEHLRSFPNADQAEILGAAQDAVFRVAMSMNVGDDFAKFNNAAAVAAGRAIIDVGRKENAQVRGGGKVKQIPDEFDAAQPKQSDGNKAGSADLQSALGKLSDEQRAIVQGVYFDNKTVAQIGQELGISPATVSRRTKEGLAALKGYLGSDDYERLCDKFRYIHGPILPEVWQEILSQAKNYGPMGPEFIRSVMEAMQRTDSQWEAIQEGRRNYLASGSQRHERSPDKPHKFSSTQFNISGPESKKILAMAAKISDDDLADDGRESHPHITVKFGLHADDAKDVAKIIGDFGPVDVRLGKTFIFPAKGESNFDVVNIEVSSAKLHRLNALISESVECTDTHPKYIPHVCLAYVKSGEGKKYVDDDTAEGIELEFNSLTFSNKFREHSELTLQKPRNYGARHQPPKRIDGAVARLEALASFAGDIDDEALEDEVVGIAREFSADDLKEIAKKFGIKRGISTKAKTLESLLAKVCDGKGET